MDPSKERYKLFLHEVVSSEKLWAIWCGDTWATSNDPSGKSNALFLLWPTKQSAVEALQLNRNIFPPEAMVDSIVVGKWLDLYTPDLIRRCARPLVFPDVSLNGLAVDPVDLKRDLERLMFKNELQGADLIRLRRNTRKKLKK